MTPKPWLRVPVCVLTRVGDNADNNTADVALYMDCTRRVCIMLVVISSRGKDVLVRNAYCRRNVLSTKAVIMAAGVTSVQPRHINTEASFS